MKISSILIIMRKKTTRKVSCLLGFRPQR